MLARAFCQGLRALGAPIVCSGSVRGAAKSAKNKSRNAPAPRGRPTNRRRRSMKIAIEGCCHGELDKIYAAMQLLEKQQNMKIDLLICCGDFQAVRNPDDLECMAVPDKYKSMQTFHKYYAGHAIAPYPTIFIGGNHEASNYLWELYYGGWVAPRIYYLGHAGVVNFGGLRIGGVSGTYSPAHYKWGHFEWPPYNDSTKRSAYHLRELEVFRMLQLKRPLDVMLTHDWPDGMAYHGNFQELFRRKKHLKAEIERGELGSKPGKVLLEELRPKYWFAAHYHIKFPALVKHEPPSDGEAADLLSRKFTNFLALDKCLPGRKYLQVLDFPASGPLELRYDEEWLAVLLSTHNLLSLSRQQRPLPGMGGSRNVVTPKAAAKAKAILTERGSANIPDNFAPTAPAYEGRRRRGSMPRAPLRNPQTVAFLDMLGLSYNLEPSAGPLQGAGPALANPEEIELDEGNPEEIELAEEGSEAEPEVAIRNPEEIDIG